MTTERSSLALGSALLAASLLLLAAVARGRPPLDRIWGDEGTFLAMTSSLARDGDLAFGAADRAWAEQRLPGEGVTVILQRAGSDLAYSKPVLYPLLAAPAYRLFGEAGLPLLNLLAMAGALALAWRGLRELGPPGRAWLTLSAFVGASVLVPYLAWRMSDALQVALCLGGLALACGGLRSRPAGGTLAAATGGGLLLGLAASMRLPNAALAVAAVAAALLVRRPRRAVAVALAAALGWSAAAGAGRHLTGAANPYKAVRSSFNVATGYPVGSGGERAAARFEGDDAATSMVGWLPAAQPALVGYSLLYFLIGRHSGAAVYFPCALLLAAVVLGRPDRVGWSLLAGAAAMAGFYLIWMPSNYFGGSTFLGNRYLLTAYPALLVALPRLPSPRALAPVWIVAFAAALSALVSVDRAGELDRLSQSHAYAGLFRLLPYESTAHRIDGHRDRYWAGDFVRFVDPYPEVGAESFRLYSDRPAAEVEVATFGPGDRIGLAITADDPGAAIEIGDRRGRDRFALDAAAGSEVVLRWAPSRAWRRHSFWWQPRTAYRVRTLRLAVRAPAGGRATAEIRYLGSGPRPTAIRSAFEAGPGTP